jgi:hypothetical protein
VTGYRRSDHARDEAKRREIPLHLIDSVMNNPQQIVSEHSGRKAYQSQLDFGGGRVLLLRAIVADDVDPAVVITVYRTSKIKRYWSNR